MWKGFYVFLGFAVNELFNYLIFCQLKLVSLMWNQLSDSVSGTLFGEGLLLQGKYIRILDKCLGNFFE